MTKTDIMAKPMSYKTWDGLEITLTPSMVVENLVRGPAAASVTMADLFFFMKTCEYYKLQPWVGHCYLIKYTPKDPAQIIVSVHYWTGIAQNHPKCNGWNRGIITSVGDGGPVYLDGCFIPPGHKLLGGWAETEIEGRRKPIKWAVPLEGYAKNTSFWKNAGHMISKIALAQLLREHYGNGAQIYAHEEIVVDSADLKQIEEGPAEEVAPEPEPEPKALEPEPEPKSDRARNMDTISELEPEPETHDYNDDPAAAVFKSLDMEIPGNVNEYVTVLVKNYDFTTEEIWEAAKERPDRFLSGFNKWNEKSAPKVDWQPRNEELKQRYSAEQREVLIAELDKAGVKWGKNNSSKELHVILLVSCGKMKDEMPVETIEQ